MRKLLVLATLGASLAIASVPVSAAGCLKGAAVGGVAGHVAGHHAVLGAVAGCAIGHHRAKVAARDKASQQLTQQRPVAIAR